MSCRYRCASVAPTASAASCSPSSTRCGAIRSSIASLRLAGSLSAPLATITLRRPRARAVASGLRATGNAAPPRPVRPAAAMSSISAPRWPRYGGGPKRPRWARRASGTAGGSRGNGGPPSPAGGRLVPAEHVRHAGGPGPLPGRAAQPPDDRGRGGAPAHDGQAEEPALLQVLARADAVHERDRPGQVGEQVDGPPQDTVQPAADQAGDDHGQHQVERDRTQAEPQSLVAGGERDDG